MNHHLGELVRDQYAWRHASAVEENFFEIGNYIWNVELQYAQGSNIRVLVNLNLTFYYEPKKAQLTSELPKALRTVRSEVPFEREIS